MPSAKEHEALLTKVKNSIEEVPKVLREGKHFESLVIDLIKDTAAKLLKEMEEDRKVAIEINNEHVNSVKCAIQDQVHHLCSNQNSIAEASIKNLVVAHQDIVKKLDGLNVSKQEAIHQDNKAEFTGERPL